MKNLLTSFCLLFLVLTSWDQIYSQSGSINNTLGSGGSFVIKVGESTTGALPVELITFSAVQNNNIQVSWTTSTEINNYGFEVKYSANLRGFDNNNGDLNSGGFSCIVH